MGEEAGHMHKRAAAWTVAWWPHFLPSGMAGGPGPQKESHKTAGIWPALLKSYFMSESRPEEHKNSLVSKIFNNFPPHQLLCSLAVSSHLLLTRHGSCERDMLPDNGARDAVVTKIQLLPLLRKLPSYLCGILGFLSHSLFSYKIKKCVSIPRYLESV